MNDVIEGTRIQGEVLLDKKDIHAYNNDVVHLRKQVGTAFQSPNPFPMSICDNITYGLRLHGSWGRAELDSACRLVLAAQRALGHFSL